MTEDKLLRVFQYYDAFFLERDIVEAERFKDQQHADANHVRWMCQEAQRFVVAGRKEKAFRWLGFVQGYLNAHQYFSIDELANHSRPDGEV